MADPRAQEEAIEEFDDAIARQPELVESTDWRVHWQQMGPR